MGDADRPTDQPGVDRPKPMRCIDCGYVLDHLEADRCPECGRPFDPKDRATWTVKPPRVPSRLWMPGVALAVALGIVAWYVIVMQMQAGWGWAATVAVPVSVGGLIGYGSRTGRPLGWLVGSIFAIAVLIFVVGSMVSGGVAMGVAGLLCGSVLGVVAILPILVSWSLGLLLRSMLKDTSWDQAAHLPILLGLIALPYVVALAEGRVQPGPATSVTTTIDLPVPADAAFAAWQFYEDVPDDIPLPLPAHLTPSLRPRRVAGDAETVGDVQTCYYEKGRLSKRITEVDPDALRVAFTVVEQVDIENNSIRLLGGSMQFEPLPDGGCRATLVTDYQPLLRPRPMWRPAETYVMRGVHEHVLCGIALEAGS